MKVRAHVGIGYVGCTRKEIINIPDDELEGLDENERFRLIDDYVRDWQADHVEWGWEPVS